MPDVISRDGLRIHYESSGRGTPVVLLHPNHATSASWGDLGWLDALHALGFRAVTLDARGFGRSEVIVDPEFLSPGTSTDDIAAVMEALEIEAAHVCGFSLGAASAVRFAIDRPARVRSLVLGGLALGPLVQCGLSAGDDAEHDRRRALEQLDRVRIMSGRESDYFVAVRAVIASATLLPLAGADLLLPILGVSGAKEPSDPAFLYAALRSAGARLEVRTIPEVGHGGCFTHPGFRSAAADFLATAQAS